MRDEEEIMGGLEEGSATERLATKVCPQCGQLLFADMMRCYGCLHDFTREGMQVPGLPATLLEEQATKTSRSWPGQSGEVPAGKAGPSAAKERRSLAACPDKGQAGPCLELVAPSRHMASVDTRDLGTGAARQLALLVQSQDMDVMLPLGKRGISVGRSPECDVVLHVRSVSRRHLLIWREGDRVLVRDQGSTNRALLRGRELRGEGSLRLGDTLDVCGTLITLVEEGGGLPEAS